MRTKFKKTRAPETENEEVQMKKSKYGKKGPKPRKEPSPMKKTVRPCNLVIIFNFIVNYTWSNNYFIINDLDHMIYRYVT